jgi:hypothetical protein
MEHAIVRAGEKLIKASWAGPPTNRELRGVEVSREDAVNVFVDSGLRVPPALLWLPEQAPPASEPAARKLTFLPGAFVYRGHRQPLSGKPLQVLQALNEAQGKTLTLAALIDKVWPDCQTGQETIRSAIAKARRALREAITTTGEQAPADPLPAVDRGTDRTAWRLNLP